MEIIIDFFRSIDGWPYYVMLIVNAILIFAIIGYIGEKSNEELAKANASNGSSNLKNGTMNLTPVHTSKNTKEESIPKVAATQVAPIPSVNQVNNQASRVTNNVSIPATNNSVGTVNNDIDPNEKAPAVLIINSDATNKDVK